MTKKSIPGFRDLRSEDIDTLKPHDRILKTAITLFNEHGVNTIGVDRLIAESNVSKRTFYSHFPAKADLISAYIGFWNDYRMASLQTHLTDIQGGPKEEILSVFDALHEWINDADFNGCPFTRGLNDFSLADDGGLRTQVDQHFQFASDFIRKRLSKIAGPQKAKVLLPQLLTLIIGSMVVAHATGNKKTAQLNKIIAAQLLSGE